MAEKHLQGEDRIDNLSGQIQGLTAAMRALICAHPCPESLAKYLESSVASAQKGVLLARNEAHFLQGMHDLIYIFRGELAVARQRAAQRPSQQTP